MSILPTLPVVYSGIAPDLYQDLTQVTQKRNDVIEAVFFLQRLHDITSGEGSASWYETFHKQGWHSLFIGAASINPFVSRAVQLFPDLKWDQVYDNPKDALEGGKSVRLGDLTTKKYSGGLIVFLDQIQEPSDPVALRVFNHVCDLVKKADLKPEAAIAFNLVIATEIPDRTILLGINNFYDLYVALSPVLNFLDSFTQGKGEEESSSPIASLNRVIQKTQNQEYDAVESGQVAPEGWDKDLDRVRRRVGQSNAAVLRESFGPIVYERESIEAGLTGFRKFFTGLEGGMSRTHNLAKYREYIPRYLLLNHRVQLDISVAKRTRDSLLWREPSNQDVLGVLEDLVKERFSQRGSNS